MYLVLLDFQEEWCVSTHGNSGLTYAEAPISTRFIPWAVPILSGLHCGDSIEAGHEDSVD